MEESIEELNFLKGELKRIDTKIKSLGYSKVWIGELEKLWELRDKIKEEIKELKHKK